MSERLTWNEIQQRYPDEWVVLVDYTLEGIEYLDGVVVDHGAVKRDVYDRSRAVSSPCALVYTGEIRRGLVGVYVQDLERTG